MPWLGDAFAHILEGELGPLAVALINMADRIDHLGGGVDRAGVIQLAEAVKYPTPPKEQFVLLSPEALGVWLFSF